MECSLQLVHPHGVNLVGMVKRVGVVEELDLELSEFVKVVAGFVIAVDFAKRYATRDLISATVMQTRTLGLQMRAIIAFKVQSGAVTKGQ